MISAIVSAVLLLGAFVLTPSKWNHRDKCVACGRHYTFYCRKNNRCPCFKKNPHGAVCGLVYMETK